jgi:hypothetical protein
VECDLANERRAAIGRERARLTSELQRREEKIKQLTERYNALVEEGIRVGYQRPTNAFVQAERDVAEVIAEEAPPLYANHPIPMTARVIGQTAPLVARILDYDAENTRVRRDQQRGFMDTLHLADIGGIPFSDETPILYPNANRWKQLSEQRERYRKPAFSKAGSREEQINDALDKQVPSFNFAETPLRDVVAQIRDRYGVPVMIDTKALEENGVDIDVPLTLSVENVSLRSALRLLLGQAELAHLIQDEVLVITTRQKAEETMVIKVYPVADLVIPVNNGVGVNPFQSGGGMGGSAGGGQMQTGLGGGGLEVRGWLVVATQG